MIAKAKADAFLAALQMLNITVDPESSNCILTEVHSLAVMYRITSYDAAYLEISVRRKLPLATLDDDLSSACKLAGEALL